MSKELTPLQKLNNLYYILCHYSNKCGVGGAYTEEECGYNAFELKKDIETALKRQDSIEITNSEQFKEKWVQDNLAMTFELNVSKKKLKALEIIKEKEVNIFIFLHSGEDLETYNDIVEDNRKLTQEEYDLLKEVLL